MRFETDTDFPHTANYKRDKYSFNRDFWGKILFPLWLMRDVIYLLVKRRDN